MPTLMQSVSDDEEKLNLNKTIATVIEEKVHIITSCGLFITAPITEKGG